MITPKQFKAQPAALATLYTVSGNQKGIIKGLTVANADPANACTFTLDVFGIPIYTTRTLGPLETFECAAAINKIGLPGDTITITPSAAVNVLGAILETPATPSS
ncbi:MAG TPA: hypothetical protein VGJ10_06090 [Paraburkholderia sp.]|jgi:hypothetical protein